MTANGTVMYYECRACKHLNAVKSPSAVAYESRQYFEVVDYGWENRNVRIVQLWKVICRLPYLGIDNETTILDFGCGKGRLVCDLTAAGFNAYGYDPFVRDAHSSRVMHDLSEVQKALAVIDVIFLIEVIEHIEQPYELMNTLKSILRRGGLILISTEVYHPQRHEQSWYYLNPEAGHVSIYSQESLLRLMRLHEFFPILRLNETLWLFGSTTRLWKRLLYRCYYVLSAARVRLKPSNLVAAYRTARE